MLHGAGGKQRLLRLCNAFIFIFTLSRFGEDINYRVGELDLFIFLVKTFE